VGRYTYRNRVYQVVVDGYSGRVLYGKAPGNIYYRALMLSAAPPWAPSSWSMGWRWRFRSSAHPSKNDSGDLVLLALPFVIGGALIFGGYRLFRWGEEIEERAKVSA